MARDLQCKVYLSETERPCELDVHSDSTAGAACASGQASAKYVI